MERVEFAVVGAGLLGLSAARALARRGHEVLVLEQAAVGHRAGGSYGASRIFRLGYDDVMYVGMAQMARELWRALEAEAGEELLHVTGQLSFGDDLDGLVGALRAAGAAAVPMSAEEARERFPGLHVPGDAVFEPESGVLAADRCLAALRATSAADVRERVRVVGVQDSGRSVKIETDAGAIEASVGVVCPGPWSATLIPNLGLAGRFTATREHIAYAAPAGGVPLGDMPIFLEHARPAPYGLPTPSLSRYKVGIHHATVVVDADTARPEPDPDAAGVLAELVRRWLPTFDAESLIVETCLYDNTPDEDFVLDRVGRVVVGAGTSGHGFKFGPLLGEILADLATGATLRLDLSRFSSARPSLAES